MARVKVDISKAIDTSKPVDQGSYYAQIKVAEIREPKEGVYPYQATCFEITEGPYAGRRIWQNFTTNPEDNEKGNGQKNWMLANLLFCLELAEEGDKELDYDTDDLINKELIIVVTVKDNENGISKFKPHS